MSARSLMAGFLSMVLLTVSALLVCTHSPVFEPEMEMTTSSSSQNMMAHCEHPGTRSCNGDHMQIFASLITGLAKDGLSMLFATLLFIVLFSAFPILHSRHQADSRIAFPKNIGFLYYVPRLIFAFSNGLIHPKRLA